MPGRAARDLRGREAERREARRADSPARRRGRRAAPRAQGVAAGVGAQVGKGRQLAAAGVGDRIDVGQVRRVHQHHVGAVGGQRAAADRAGEDARQVEHAHAGERPAVCGSARQRAAGASPMRSIATSGCGGDRSALRVRVPFVEAAQRGDDEAGLAWRPVRSRAASSRASAARPRALGVRADRQAEQSQHAVAVVREVGVQAHPAATGTRVQRRPACPRLRRTTVDREAAAALERRVAHVDAHLLAQAVAPVADLGGGQRRGRERRLRGGADRERRRQHRVGAGQREVLQRRHGRGAASRQINSRARAGATDMTVSTTRACSSGLSIKGARRQNRQH